MTVGYFLGKGEKARSPEFRETRGGVGRGRLLLFLEWVFLGCLPVGTASGRVAASSGWLGLVTCVWVQYLYANTGTLP